MEKKIISDLKEILDKVKEQEYISYAYLYKFLEMVRGKNKDKVIDIFLNSPDFDDEATIKICWKILDLLNYKNNWENYKDFMKKNNKLKMENKND